MISILKWSKKLIAGRSGMEIVSNGIIRRIWIVVRNRASNDAGKRTIPTSIQPFSAPPVKLQLHSINELLWTGTAFGYLCDGKTACAVNSA